MAPDPSKPKWKSLMQKLCGVMLELPELHNQLKAQQKIIEEERVKTFKAKRVFCTFETEHSQRNCLTKLSCGYLAAFFDRSASVPFEHRFREENVLIVHESSEPAAMNWMSMGIRLRTKIAQVSEWKRALKQKRASAARFKIVN